MANKDNQLFDVPDPEAAGWKEDPDRPGYWLWETEMPVTEAPEDGKQYGRQDASWTEIVIPASQWQGGSGGISTNAAKVIVGTENGEGAGLYASGKIEVWETAQNNNRLWAGYGAGSITSFIQADGDAKFSGNVDLLGVGRYGRASLGFDTNLVFARGSNDLPTGVDLGNSSYKWNNAHFAGTVVAGAFELADGSPIGGAPDLTGYATEAWVTNGFQPKGSYLEDFTETDPTVPDHVKSISSTNISNWDTAHGWGDHASANYATQTWVNNKGYSTYTGSDAVKTSGNQTIGGAKTFSSNVTAPDFVATSDERVKDNITTAPVGLIDSLKGREWDWKESGEKGSGVVAQELEQILPHLVHEDDGGMKSVAYNGLIAYLIEEIKDLKAQVETLKNG